MNNNNAKQLTRFPYCRIYRRFLKNLTENHLIRKHGDGFYEFKWNRRKCFHPAT